MANTKNTLTVVDLMRQFDALFEALPDAIAAINAERERDGLQLLKGNISDIANRSLSVFMRASGVDPATKPTKDEMTTWRNAHKAFQTAYAKSYGLGDGWQIMNVRTPMKVGEMPTESIVTSRKRVQLTLTESERLVESSITVQTRLLESIRAQAQAHKAASKAA